jgi:hypothetical protein
MTTECKRGPGGHRDQIIEAWEMMLNLQPTLLRRHPYRGICEQLSHCRDDEARRLILGISEQKEQA